MFLLILSKFFTIFLYILVVRTLNGFTNLFYHIFLIYQVFFQKFLIKMNLFSEKSQNFIEKVFWLLFFATFFTIIVHALCPSASKEYSSISSNYNTFTSYFPILYFFLSCDECTTFLLLNNLHLVPLAFQPHIYTFSL